MGATDSVLVADLDAPAFVLIRADRRVVSVIIAGDGNWHTWYSLLHETPHPVEPPDTPACVLKVDSAWFDVLSASGACSDTLRHPRAALVRSCVLDLFCDTNDDPVARVRVAAVLRDVAAGTCTGRSHAYQRGCMHWQCVSTDDGCASRAPGAADATVSPAIILAVHMCTHV